MRWVRLKTLIACLITVIYFFFVHAKNSGMVVSEVTMLCIVMVFGSAFVDRLFFDPSAIFVSKPWRVMQPSAGDRLRLFVCGSVSVLILPFIILRGGYLADPALFEASLVAVLFFIFELTDQYVERVRWHGANVDFRSKLGLRVTMKWTDIRSIRRSWFADYLIFKDKSGREVKIGRRRRGYPEFIRDAERYVPASAQHAIRNLK